VFTAAHHVHRVAHIANASSFSIYPKPRNKLAFARASVANRVVLAF
jgi:hypothetical protein